MAQISRENEFAEENIEGTYQKLAKLLEAKNDLQTNTSASTAELIENEHKVEEMEHILREMRSEISGNPILHNINRVWQEDDDSQRKLAENIYSEYHSVFTCLNDAEEEKSSFEEAYLQLEKSHLSIAKLLDDETERNKTFNDSLCRMNGTNNDEELLLSTNAEAEANIEKMWTEIKYKKDNLALLEHQSLQNHLQKSTEIYNSNMKTLTETSVSQEKLIASINEGNDVFSKYEATIKQEMDTKLKNFEDDNDILQEQLVSQEESKNKFSEQIQTTRELFTKKILYDSINIQKNVIEKGCQEQNTSEESIKTCMKLIDCHHSDMAKIEQEKDEINIHLDKIEKSIEAFMLEKNILTRRNESNQEKMHTLDAELEDLNKINQETEDMITKTCSEREVSLLKRKEVIEERLSNTQRELKERISKLKSDLEEQEKSLINFQIQFDSMERENQDLVMKIPKYSRAIEISKKRKNSLIEKAHQKTLKSLPMQNSDTSQDSMLI